MISSAIVSALHLLALALGLPSVFLRGRALARNDLPALFRADNVWGLAAVLWLATGLARAFGGLEKGTAYYEHSRVFGLKLMLFVLLVLLELYPMVTFIRWRRRLKRHEPIDATRLPLLRKLNHAEVGLVLVIPFVAACMARGIGY
ncbi:MAG: DUF2214 family protein [Archangiaceae bacterium]|nr:DUF2214 family protein [Archangiaceae bacterium]